MLLARFLQDRRGSLLPTFALATTGVIGFVGAAVDYSRASSTKAAIQTALDATGLILSREAEKLDPTQLKQKATDYFTAQFTRPEAKNIQVDSLLTSPQQGTFVLKVSATATVDATVARVIGQSQMNVGSSAEIKWGIKKLEIALVLDNTWSMNSNGKMAALKTATHNLLNKLQAAAKEPGDVKVAIIPFDTMVNIGTGFKDEFWINYSVKNIQMSSWTGCVIDRDQSNDVKDTTPVQGTTSTYYPAQNCSALAEAMQLSTDWTALHTKVDGMAPVPANSSTGAGYTNVTIGLVWGWHALTSEPAVHRRLGAEAGRTRQGDRAADRRRQHAQSLDHVEQQLVLDRRAHGARLHQRQDGRDQALHRPGDRRRQDAADQLRHAADHVLRRRAGRSAQFGVQLDRAGSDQAAHREVGFACGHPSRRSPAQAAGDLLRMRSESMSAPPQGA